MATTVVISSESKAYGNTKNYVARITGRDSQYTYQREFLGKDARVDTPGLYEICNLDKKGRKSQIYRIVVPAVDGVALLRVGGDHVDSANIAPEDVAMQIAKRIGDGEAIETIIAVTSDGKYRVTAKGETATPDRTALEAEAAKLQTRLAEIEQLLRG